jgi:glycosyltransferase involved in cell wall biosynthesis
VVVITKNEERNIGDCLQSVTWADEVIVVDAQSTDRTTVIAKTYTDRVYVRPWPGYGPQKNFGIDQVEAEWVLVLDADERVTPDLQGEICRTIAAAPAEVGGYEIPRRNYFYGEWLRGGGVYPDRQLRLFRRSAGRYDDVLLHERLQLTGQIARLESPLIHHSIPTVQHHVRKIARYSVLAAQEKLRRGGHLGGAGLAASHLMTIFRVYILRRGYRDGIPGLLFAVLSGMHTFLKYARAYELRQGGPTVSSPVERAS